MTATGMDRIRNARPASDPSASRSLTGRLARIEADLGQIATTGLRPAALGGASGVAGDEEDRQVGALLAGDLGQLAAVEAAGQADIGDQQIDFCVRLQDS